MALEKLSDILADARKNQYGVASFNFYNYESALCIAEAANEERLPVIMMFVGGFGRHMHPADASAVVRSISARFPKIPMAFHLDHNREFENIVYHMQWFPSVMYDGSSLPFEENVKNTREVVRVAHAMGIEVEGELGHVGTGMNLADFQDESIYTKPEDAKLFVEETGCDFLAVAIGNAHGKYAATPKLNFDRLKELRAAVDIPLVLHGGSGIPDEQFHETVRCGMGKYNIFTEVNSAAMEGAIEALKDGPIRGAGLGLAGQMKAAMLPVYQNRIRVLNPNGYKAF